MSKTLTFGTRSDPLMLRGHEVRQRYLNRAVHLREALDED